MRPASPCGFPFSRTHWLLRPHMAAPPPPHHKHNDSCLPGTLGRSLLSIVLSLALFPSRICNPSLTPPTAQGE
ncbi:hypothetical protein COCSADRAFT_34987 [Bipolaris sorokiniana ND90Pr]|uniref:Uncharacterized protein n=1 Tax=Cochliobolus sativus (strain ND90Pr / ATCC 201652) TaxID=665912 RepID=M2SGY0_COCSN|nr:uncharacterized protein COCSADRAFT_34987 [Bipolaris sorokiniana ND90Pr]EMD66473.1 hypothetical protein COCSADRAFT_34987 [Bipolaris sorokiniana ND90Pr]